MYLKKLSLFNFRNFSSITMTFSDSGAFFFGENGSGKTNILESISMIFTGKSQRNASKNEMIRHHEECSRIEGTLFSEQQNKTIELCYSFTRKNNAEMHVNGSKQRSFSDWFGIQPIVTFSPGDIDLVYGPPVIRRRFLDMLISLVDKEYLSKLIEYQRNLHERNVLLKSLDDDLLLSVYEKGMSKAAEYLFFKRKSTLEELQKYTHDEHQYLSGKSNVFSLNYSYGYSIDKCGIKSWNEVFYDMLFSRRKRDREFGFTSCGPHRDEILFSVDSKPVKTYSSQGECRTVALALKLGSMRFLEKYGTSSMIVLFDDAVSELDMKRSDRVYNRIMNRGQVMIASPNHNDLIVSKNMTCYRVEHSSVVAYDR